MRYLTFLILAICLTGCSLVPGLKMPESWKSLGSTGKAAAAVVVAQKESENVKQLSDADKKVEEARKKMELEYAKFREDLQKAYDDGFVEVGLKCGNYALDDGQNDGDNHPVPLKFGQR